MKLKKVVGTLAVGALAATMAVGGTLAYLTDAEADVNVASTGDVDIEQIELKRADGVEHSGTAEEGDLVPFKDGVPLYPAVPTNGKSTDYSAEKTDLFYWGDYVTANGAGNGLWNDEKLYGAMDKFVFVKNTGNSPCYYRTWLAFECPEGMEYSGGADKHFMMNTNGHDLFSWESAGYHWIEGTRYYVLVATYQAELAPTETSRPSLLQVVMTDKVENDDVKKLDGSYEILAYSEACQVENLKKLGSIEAALNEAFGDPSEGYTPWAESNIYISETEAAELEKETGKLTGFAPDITGAVIDGMTILDDTEDGEEHNLRALYRNGMTGDLTITNSLFDGTYAMNVTAAKGATAELTASNTTFMGWTSFSGFTSATFTDCKFMLNSEGTYNYLRSYDDATFIGCEFTGTKLDVQNPYSGNATAGSIVLENCTFNGEPITEDMLKDIVENYADVEGSIIIK